MNNLRLTQSEWLNIAIQAKWIPDNGTVKIATSQAALIRNATFRDRNLALTPEDWLRIGFQTRWLTKEALDAPGWNWMKDKWNAWKAKRQDTKKDQQLYNQMGSATTIIGNVIANAKAAQQSLAKLKTNITNLGSVVSLTTQQSEEITTLSQLIDTTTTHLNTVVQQYGQTKAYIDRGGQVTPAATPNAAPQAAPGAVPPVINPEVAPETAEMTAETISKDLIAFLKNPHSLTKASEIAQNHNLNLKEDLLPQIHKLNPQQFDALRKDVNNLHLIYNVQDEMAAAAMQQQKVTRLS